MYTILLSGGSGKRLWPLSNDLRSKQYIRLISKEDDETERCSMVQRVWSQLEKCGLSQNSIITASTGQVEIIKSQLGDVNIAVEPDRRDTFPAVALSCAYVKSKLGATDDDFICILPVDPYTESSYFETVKTLEEVLNKTGADVALMGAVPSCPSSKYGYIVPSTITDTHITVESFKEKPTKEQAEELIKQGAIWNCGVFCFKIGKVLGYVEKYGVSCDYDEMFANYDKLPKISFDYEVLEKADKLVAVTFNGYWKDLGTWNSLAEQMSTETIGNVILHESCKNTHVVNELNTPIIAMGMKDVIIAVSFDGIFISDKNKCSFIKECTEMLDVKPMYEERRWGTIKTIDMSEKNEILTLTRKVLIFKGMSSSYHYHEKRDEVWTVLRGRGELILDGVKTEVATGCAIRIPSGAKHAIKAIEEIEFMEIHIGKIIGNDDINRITFDWDKISKNIF